MTEHGLFPGMPAEHYHQLEAISKSGLDRVHVSIPHYLAWRKFGEDTVAMKRGRALHTFMLDGKDAFFDEFAVIPEDKRRGTKQFKFWAQDYIGKDLLTMGEYRDIKAMRDSIATLLKAMSKRHHPGLDRLLADARHIEASCMWRDPEWDIPCRVRPDIVSREGIIFDIKTTKDASDRSIASTMAEFRYHVQDPWYQRGYEAATGERPLGFAFLFVESSRPWTPRLVDIPSGWRAVGEAAIQEDAQRFADFYHDGKGLEIQSIDLPHWAAE